MTDKPVMLILRGIAGTFGGKSYPRGALDEESATAYARLRGYEPRVLDVSGEAATGSKQHKMALAEVISDPSIEAIYGFSGGAYNLAHVLDDLTPDEKEQLNLVVALGAPSNPASRYKGPWETVYRTDPPTGHMDGPRVLLVEAQKEQESKPTMAAMPLRYLIAVEDKLAGKPAEITEVGYDGPRPTSGPAVRYGNLYDQTGTGKYGPYLRATDTASEYDERVVDPGGSGWRKLLTDQCLAAKAAGFTCIELDNPDGYTQAAVLSAIQFVADQGFTTLAKNPLICDWDAVPYVKHPAVVGIIVEKDDGATPAVYDDLRKAAGKPELPVYFVAFKDGKENGTTWATATAIDAANYSNMWVTMSSDGEYTSSADLTAAAPPVYVVSPPLAPTADNFPACVKLLLVHEGGNDDDPRDPGGRTSRGIIQSEYDVWRRDHAGLPADVWQAPQATILDIYRAKYWNVMRCDDLPAGMDYCVFDYGVNSGVSRGIKLLQTTLGIAVDGAMGPLTIAAAKSVRDLVAFVNKYQDARLNFLRGLGTWSVFGRGWSTRVADVRKDAIGMAGGGTVPPEQPVQQYDTQWVQQSLNSLGQSPPLKEDGKAGPVTANAIKQFQTAHGLKADGIAGPLTRARIVQDLNLQGSAPPVLEQPPDVTLPPVGELPKPTTATLLLKVIAGMEAKGYRIDKGPGEINIAYAEGHNRDGSRNDNKPGLWNDVRLVFSYESGEPVQLGSWIATTQPGPYYTINPINSAGAANIFPGQYKAWRVALHRGQYEALCQRGTLTLTRDKNKDYSREGDKVEVGSEEGINQHHGSNASEVGPHSAGCLVGKMVDGHEDFMAISKSDPRYKADHNFMFTSAILAQSEVPL